MADRPDDIQVDLFKDKPHSSKKNIEEMCEQLNEWVQEETVESSYCVDDLISTLSRAKTGRSFIRRRSPTATTPRKISKSTPGSRVSLHPRSNSVVEGILVYRFGIVWSINRNL